MITIKLSREPLVSTLFPNEIEILYISLTNEIMNYAKIITKKNFNKQKLETVLFKLSSVDVGGQSNVFLQNLAVEKNMIEAADSVLGKKLNESLNKLHKILKEIKDGKSINDIGLKSREVDTFYSDEELQLIDSYINLRKKAYTFVEYIGTIIIKGNIPKEKEDSILLSIALDSLSLINIDSMLKNGENFNDMITLMNNISTLLNNRDLNIEDIKRLQINLKDSIYSNIIDKMISVYKSYLSKTIK